MQDKKEKSALSKAYDVILGDKYSEKRGFNWKSITEEEHKKFTTEKCNNCRIPLVDVDYDCINRDLDEGGYKCEGCCQEADDHRIYGNDY